MLLWGVQALRKSLKETARVVTEVPEAPVFRPSSEEWEDPLAYVASIHETAAKFGIVRIIPPTGARWPAAGLPACVCAVDLRPSRRVMRLLHRLRACAVVPSVTLSVAITASETLHLHAFLVQTLDGPAGWVNPDLELNITQRFKTKQQSVHKLQEGQPFGEVRRRATPAPAISPTEAWSL